MDQTEPSSEPRVDTDDELDEEAVELCVSIAPPMADLGFPDDFSAAAEFDPFEYQAHVVKSVGLDVEGRPDAPLSEAAFDPYAEAFSHGAVFAPGSAGFERPRRDVAPPKPSYLDLERTTYKTTRPLATVKEHLEAAFPEVSFDWTVSAEHPCGYECTAMRLLGRIELEICIFSEGAAHLVEIRHLFGCRYAFSEAASDLAKQLKVDWIGGSAEFKMPFAPPPLPAGVALEPPPGFSGAVLTPEQYAAQACEPVLSLLSKESPRSMRLQGARAAGKFAAGDIEGKLFATGCPGIAIAARLVELVQVEQGASKHTDKEMQCVAMAAIANVAALAHACPEWSSGPVVKVITEGADDSDAHVKREALRAAFSLTSRGFARKESSLRDVLHSHVEGPNTDSAAMSFAREALKACQ